MARISLAEAQARASTVDRDLVAATGEAEIRRHMIEDGYDPDAEPPAAVRVVYPPRTVRERYGMTQAAFAAWIGVPLGTWQNWEQGRTSPDAAIRTLLTLLAREPDAARRALGTAAE